METFLGRSIGNELDVLEWVLDRDRGPSKGWIVTANSSAPYICPTLPGCFYRNTLKNDWSIKMVENPIGILFDERPIWIKESLAELLLEKGLNFGSNMLRRWSAWAFALYITSLLFRTAYYFSNGPFLRFWIRKGFDPRKDRESCIYQRIDFRVPPSLRSYCDTKIASGLTHRWEDICAFRVFPYKCQISLQLFELVDDYIQQEIRKPSNQATCSCATGWFSSHVLDSLRLHVAVRFLSVYPKPGAESLLKSASARFEKSKRVRIPAKDSRPDVKRQQVNKGSS
ncbi:unnamed protein product [Ilex paraguariensis]|uniref:Transcription factor IIIC subunit 5 HTH domain-containing protein n=1 Tax=Ilex paraguariensis TaxID=185542 RepID=A0ABC8UYP4_9AQUA